MSAYAIIENGMVINVAMADPEYAAEQGWIAAQGAGIGWSWNGSTFTAPPAPPESVPVSVPMLNARLALIDQGHMANVNAILAASPGVQGEKARTFFEFAQNVRRDHWVVEALRVSLTLTHEQIDQLFILALTLG